MLRLVRALFEQTNEVSEGLLLASSVFRELSPVMLNDENLLL
jgi:hypothetical protein